MGSYWGNGKANANFYLGFRVEGFQVWGSGFRVQGLGFRVVPETQIRFLKASFYKGYSADILGCAYNS